jgi:hypothetical protein
MQLVPPYAKVDCPENPNKRDISTLFCFICGGVGHKVGLYKFANPVDP